MVYTATTWTEGVTTLGPTNMNKIETELVYLDTRIPPAALGYGTTLPGSPVDGQETVLVDSTTNPTYQWRFRYNAGSSSAYKWEFIGGAPVWTSDSAASASNTTITFVEGDTACRITVARAGDYIVSGTGRLATTTAATLAQAALGTTAAIASGVLITEFRSPTAGNNAGGYAGSARFNAVAASTIFCQGVRNGSGDSQTVSYQYRSLNVVPVRVS
jgi:hypothetical protein